MKKSFFLSLLVMSALAVSVRAQESSAVGETLPATDSLTVRQDSILAAYNAPVSISDISDNPFYFRLFMPLTLYGSVIDDAVDLPGEFVFGEEETGRDDSDLLPIEDFSGKENELESEINNVLMNIYLERPDMVRMTEQELRTITGSVNIDTEGLANGLIQQTTNQGQKLSDKYEPEPVNIKPKYWKKFGKFSGKYTQSQYSENWYKGGESNHSVLAQVTLEANYAKNQATLDNKLEMKLGYYTTEVDGETKMKTNEDLLRFTSKYGLKAWQSWYYSAQVQGYTQFMAVYDKKVPTKLKSKFFAPAYGNISIGMDYKPKFKNNNITLSAQISPLSYNCRYVSVDSIVTSFGIKEGENFLKTIGSRVESNFKWKYKDFTWTAKAMYFTNYESVESNLENTIDYQLNKYFSLQFFCHWRFDDSVKRKTNKNGDLMGYHQYKEFLTLNFNYSW
ncbi:MAG: DUF3078 domain-containing protein [Bacteroidaceae bacterium]|nr:DUF3078 domain-containing protein [Bacteroidaceae bacterium]